MSLHNVAHHLAAKGRNGDSVLVHMTPNEVSGLHALAAAQGGHLTINPETGLVEANFLKAMLPMLAGGLLTASGVFSPIGAAMLVGGATGLAKGSLKEGLMAGLGAFGGAGIGAGLAGLGAAGASGATAAGTTAAESAATAGTTAADSLAPTAASNVASTGATQVANQSAMEAAKQEALKSATLDSLGGAGNAGAVGNAYNAGVPMAETAPSMAAESYAPAAQSQSGIAGLMGPPAPPAAPTGMAGIQSAGQGIQQLAQDPANAMGNLTARMPTDFAASTYGKAAAVPLINEATKVPEYKAPPESPSYVRSYTYDPKTQKYVAAEPVKTSDWSAAKYQAVMNKAPSSDAGQSLNPYGYDAYTRERNWFPSYAGGGDIDGSTFAQGGVFSPAVSSVADAAVDPYTGAPKFAEGGSTDSKPAEKYAMSGQSADAFKYLMGQSPTSQSAPVNQGGPTMHAQPVGPAVPVDSAGVPIAGLPALGDPTYGTLPQYSYDPNTQTFTPKATAIPDLSNVFGRRSGVTTKQKALGFFGGMAAGGITDLGGYSDGGRLLQGPGDGVSDSIPADIAGKQPARLADGEFVVPARIVSELGNGSTQAGARKLYAMMDRVQKSRAKTVGKGKVAVDSKAVKNLPA